MALDRVKLDSDEQYAKAVEALRCPESVSGYREVRYPKQDAARARVEELLGGGNESSPKVVVTVDRNVLDSLRSPTHA